MNLKIFKVLLSLILIFTFTVSGCAKTDISQTAPPRQFSASETVYNGAEIKAWHTLNGTQDMSVTTTDSDGNISSQTTYSVSTNTTVTYLYEYDENGNLIHEYNYSADGNYIDEFTAGNFESANAYGEIHYDIEKIISVEDAFFVTVEELAPLYKRAEQLWKKYGVIILIADKVTDHTYGAELCYDYEHINACLDLAERCLACYPKDFFRDFDADVCIQLVGTGSSAGLYMGGYKQLLIQIDVNCFSLYDGYVDDGYYFSYTLHHEISHMICDKLRQRADSSSVPLDEERWNSYNPDGFEYVGSYDDQAEIELYEKGDNYLYFVFSYGCSTAGEDRAIMFGEAMTYAQGYEHSGFSEQINAKLAYYSNCLRAGFDSDHWDKIAPWELILNK